MPTKIPGMVHLGHILPHSLLVFLMNHLDLDYVHYVMLRTLIWLNTVFTTVLGYYLKGDACGSSFLALMLMFMLCHFGSHLGCYLDVLKMLKGDKMSSFRFSENLS